MFPYFIDVSFSQSLKVLVYNNLLAFIVYDSCTCTYNVDRLRKDRAGDGCVYSSWRRGYAVWTLVSVTYLLCHVYQI